MAAKSFGEAVAEELAGKAIMWGPAIAGALLLGPLGALVGLMASVSVVASASDDSSSSGDGEQGTK